MAPVTCAGMRGVLCRAELRRVASCYAVTRCIVTSHAVRMHAHSRPSTRAAGAAGYVDARTHAHTHAHTHARTHAQLSEVVFKLGALL